MNVTIGDRVFRVTSYIDLVSVCDHARHMAGDYADADCKFCMAMADEAKRNRAVMDKLTVARLLDIVDRAERVIEDVDAAADGYSELLLDVRALRQLCIDTIGESHMGAARDEVILARSDAA